MLIEVSEYELAGMVVNAPTCMYASCRHVCVCVRACVCLCVCVWVCVCVCVCAQVAMSNIAVRYHRFRDGQV